MAAMPPSPEVTVAAGLMPPIWVDSTWQPDSKGAKTTNWAARRLTPKQITYAATDAWVCRELYLRFKQLNLV